MYALYVYVVSSKCRSIHKSQRSFVAFFSFAQMRDEWLSGVPTTPTNTLFVPAILAFVHDRLWQSTCATLYEHKVSRYQYGKLDYGELEGTERICWRRIVRRGVRSLISKADDLWRASTFHGTSWPLSCGPAGSMTRGEHQRTHTKRDVLDMG